MVKAIGPVDGGGARNLPHEVSRGHEATLGFPHHGHAASKSSRSTAHRGKRDRNPRTLCFLLGPLLKAMKGIWPQLSRYLWAGGTTC